MASQKGESLSQDLAVSGGLKDLGISGGLHLEGLVLWDVIETENSVKKKDRQIQSLRRDYKNLSMDEEELILNYFEKLSHVVIELISLREKILCQTIEICLRRRMISVLIVRSQSKVEYRSYQPFH
ncbi:unnamed protein product [Spirodela intermedia]|uniref:Uncharacterized protein n=1 Tax=Spirodela intermedia TaxID=51605 RepID=A0A7I8JLX0_SPIIN|nr:unnamed protein product [Spirodela intermedia]CAA6670563.1 unnamed protein product [Spirodela intermedia]